MKIWGLKNYQFFSHKVLIVVLMKSGNNLTHFAKMKMSKMKQRKRPFVIKRNQLPTTHFEQILNENVQKLSHQ